MASTTAFERHIQSIGRFQLLTPEREKELSRIINGKCTPKEKDKAIEELVGSNTRLVIDLAKKFSRMGSLEDLVADGNVGLVIAAQRYDYRKKKKGVGRFSTFAAYYIRCYIMKGLRQRTRAGVHIPPNVFSSIPSVLKAISENPGITLAGIARRTRLSVSAVKSAKKALEISIVEYMGAGVDGSELILPADSHQPDPSDLAHISQLFNLVMDTAKDLGYGPEELSLLTSNIGDSDFLARMASKRGVSKSRIRMLKKEMMWRIRKRLKVKIGREEFEMFFPGFLHPNSWRHNPIPCRRSSVHSS